MWVVDGKGFIHCTLFSNMEGLCAALRCQLRTTHRNKPMGLFWMVQEARAADSEFFLLHGEVQKWPVQFNFECRSSALWTSDSYQRVFKSWQKYLPCFPGTPSMVVAVEQREVNSSPLDHSHLGLWQLPHSSSFLSSLSQAGSLVWLLRSPQSCSISSAYLCFPLTSKVPDPQMSQHNHCGFQNHGQLWVYGGLT